MAASRAGEFRNNRHFEENFQDSELSLGNNNFDNGPGRAIQLVKMKPYGKIQVDQDALDLISQCDLPVGFCCIAGKYRTGKSFLLNKLLKLEGNGFRVDPSVSACTEGIWMWSKPLMNQKEGNYIFFIDTEGSASTNRDSTNDAKVFTLANLISSYLIYNSVGVIDEKSISELNVVTQLSKNIVLDEYAGQKNSEENLHKYMPNFLWLIRDFVLEPTDKNGRKLQPAQYLENVLFEQNAAVKADQSTKKIRRALTQYYKNRDCMTLVRPAYEEKDLQNLNQLPDHLLRKDFIEGVNRLRDKIVKSAGPKIYQDNPLFGGAIASMLESYVNMMNNGAIPSIHTAWEQINQDEGVYAYDMALQRFGELYQQNFQEEEPKGEQIYNLLRVISQASMDEFHNHISQPNEVYEGRLKEYLAGKERDTLKVNKALILNKNIEILKQCMGPVMEKIESNSYDNNPEQVHVDIRQASQRFNQRAKGENKGQMLSEFLTTINPIILNVNNRSRKTISQQEDTERIRKEYEDRVEKLQQQISSLQNQNASKMTVNELKAGKVNQNINNGKDTKKVPSKGCCGGTTKCSVM